MKSEILRIKTFCISKFRDVRTGKEDIRIHRNLVVTVGKESIMKRLIGDTGISLLHTGEITVGAVGTGTTAPTIGDTGLETEIFRKLLAVRSFTGGLAFFRLFLNTSEGNGSLKEFGLFGDSTDDPPAIPSLAVTMYNRFNIDRVKDVSKTLTIEVTISVV